MTTTELRPCWFTELRITREVNPTRSTGEIGDRMMDWLCCNGLRDDGDAIYSGDNRIISIFAIRPKARVYFARAEDALFEGFAVVPASSAAD